MNDRRLYLREMGVIFRNGLLFRNPVLVGALGLYPVAAAGFGLRDAAALSMLFLFLALPSELVLCLGGMLVPRWARPGAVLLVTALFYVPGALAMQRLVPGAADDLGMAAALMTCNSVLYSRAEEYAPEHVLPAVLADAVGCSFGFAAVLCLVASLRELWLTGGVWGRGFSGEGIGSGMDLPFAGFLLAGFLAAGVQQINLRRTERFGREG